MFSSTRTWILVLTAMFFSACCHTNNMKDYSVTDQTFHFFTSVDPSATTVDLRIDSPAPGKNAVVDILAGVGSEVLSSEASAKLNRAVNPTGIAASVSMGFEKVLEAYFKAHAVGTPADNPAFMVETRLKECSLRSQSSGIELCLKVQTEIVDVVSGKTVWRDCQDTYVPIKRTPAGTVPLPVIGAAMSVYNATEFFKLSDRDLQDVILGAAQDVGGQLGKSLRHDHAK